MFSADTFYSRYLSFISRFQDGLSGSCSQNRNPICLHKRDRGGGGKFLRQRDRICQIFQMKVYDRFGIKSLLHLNEGGVCGFEDELVLEF